MILEVRCMPVNIDPSLSGASSKVKAISWENELIDKRNAMTKRKKFCMEFEYSKA
jgi:hypothetical protein